ncbi:MAG: endonuclease, partial [Flavobacteriaceae bacterium]|nr:endonuclease [Flavobacteriaceae bacterium]
MLHTVAFYNVENLYDIYDDKRTLDDDYTYFGQKSWNRKRYEDKLVKLSKTLKTIGWEETQKLPAFFGLAEIENRKVLEDLLHHFPHQGTDYGFLHQDSLDERGIDTAFFYDKKFFTLEKYEFIRIPVFNPDGSRDFTRDIVYAQGSIGQEKVHFFTLHLPSKRDEDINLSKRIYLLQQLRKRIDKIFEKDEKANVLILGDFNENPDAKYFCETLRCRRTIAELYSTDLFNPYENLFRDNRFSTAFSKKGELFDQIIFSPAFFRKENPVKFVKAEIFNA